MLLKSGPAARFLRQRSESVMQANARKPESFPSARKKPPMREAFGG
jgi:hypothetical protein